MVLSLSSQPYNPSRKVCEHIIRTKPVSDIDYNLDGFFSILAWTFVDFCCTLVFKRGMETRTNPCLWELILVYERDRELIVVYERDRELIAVYERDKKDIDNMIYYILYIMLYMIYICNKKVYWNTYKQDKSFELEFYWVFSTEIYHFWMSDYQKISSRNRNTFPFLTPSVLLLVFLSVWSFS